MQKTAKATETAKATHWHNQTFANNMASLQTVSPYITSGGNIDINYSPTITWQDTSSAATYTSAASVLNS